MLPLADRHVSKCGYFFLQLQFSNSRAANCFGGMLLVNLRANGTLQPPMLKHDAELPTSWFLGLRIDVIAIFRCLMAGNEGLRKALPIGCKSVLFE